MRKLLLSITTAMLLSGGAYAQHGRVIPIDSIQYVSPQDLASGKDDPTFYQYGDTVTIEGRVTYNPAYYGLSTSRKGSFLQGSKGSWDGIHVLIDPGRLKQLNGIDQDITTLNQNTKFYENFTPGLKVKVTGILDDFQGNTQLVLLPYETEITDLTPKMPAPVKVQISDFRKSDQLGGQVDQYTTGEQYEGIYVEFRDVTVVDVTNSGNGRFYWYLQDADGNKIQVRDLSRYYRNDNLADSTPANYTFNPPAIGSRLSYIRGVIVHTVVSSQDMYQLAPLTASDMGPIQSAPPVVKSVSRTPQVPSSSDKVTIKANITDDNEGVKSAVLYYSVGLNNTSYSSINMTAAGSDMYTADIPAQADGSVVNFWIKSTDNGDHSIYYPDSLKKGLHYLVKNSGIKSISDIQIAPYGNGNSAWENDTLKNISVGGIVTSTTAQNDLGMITIQSSHVGPYSGIFIGSKVNMPLDSIKRGDSVLITQAIVRENITYRTTNFTGNTFLDNVSLQVVSHNNALPAPVKGLPTDSFTSGHGPYGEPYEAMLVEFNNVYVADTNPDRASANSNYGEWTMSTDSTVAIGIRADDFSNDINYGFNVDSLEMGQKLEYIRGILTYNYGNWKIMPRNRDDIDGFHTEKQPDAIAPLAAATFGMYPNPATNVLNISLSQLNGQARIQVLDMSGRVVLEQTSNSPQAQIQTGGLKPGIYVVRVNDRKSAAQQKLIIRR